MNRLILKNRYTLLLTVLLVYMIVLVVEGEITGREAWVIEFENPFFDLNFNNPEEFMNRDQRIRFSDEGRGDGDDV